VELLGFVEYASYDEATTLMGVRQDTALIEQCDAEAQGSDDVQLGLQYECVADSIKESVPAKVFQTDAAWAALVKVPPSEGAAPQYLVITSSMATKPQVVQRTTAECIAQYIVLQSISRGPTLGGFDMRVRLVATDRYAAQFLAER
jgi:hypothetical protein